MSQSAQVRSLDRLKQLEAALIRFRVDAQTALGAAEMALRRVHDILDERLRYWKQQVNKRQEDVQRARSDLSYARSLHEGKSVGCVEQELALRKAQERLREAEGKVATVLRWQRELPNFEKDLEGPMRGMAGFLEADLRQGIAQLGNKIASLEAYLSLLAPDLKESP